MVSVKQILLSMNKILFVVLACEVLRRLLGIWWCVRARQTLLKPSAGDIKRMCTQLSSATVFGSPLPGISVLFWLWFTNSAAVAWPVPRPGIESLIQVISKKANGTDIILA